MANHYFGYLALAPAAVLLSLVKRQRWILLSLINPASMSPAPSSETQFEQRSLRQGFPVAEFQPIQPAALSVIFGRRVLLPAYRLLLYQFRIFAAVSAHAKILSVCFPLLLLDTRSPLLPTSLSLQLLVFQRVGIFSVAASMAPWSDTALSKAIDILSPLP